MHDTAGLRTLLAGAGFREARIEAKRVRIDGVSARDIAIGQFRGTPRIRLLESRGANIDELIDKVTAALTRIGGADPYRADANAVVVEAVAA
jgi:hypothetical protein